jgi:hypothetical protein
VATSASFAFWPIAVGSFQDLMLRRHRVVARPSGRLVLRFIGLIGVAVALAPFRLAVGPT